jgi:transcription elongation regulator 1
MTLDAAKKQTEDGKSILNSWTETKKLIKDDPRYSKMPRRDRETWWRRYADDLQRKLKPVSSKSEKLSGSDGSKAGSVDAVHKRRA